MAHTAHNEEIIADLLALYQCKPLEVHYRHFAEDVEFEDPLEYASGIASVRSSLNSLPKLFTKSETKRHNVVTNEKDFIRFYILQNWEIGGIHKQKEIEHQIDVKLRDGKITRIEDRWWGNPLPNKEEGGKMGSLEEVISKIAMQFKALLLISF